MVIPKLIHVPQSNFVEGLCLLNCRASPGFPGPVVSHSNGANRVASADDDTYKFLTYQLFTVGYWPTVAMTGDGGLGFDSGEGA